MTQDIYIGVDGGGTKCKVRVEDSAGSLLGTTVSGPANIRISVDGTWLSIFTALHEILNPLHISLEDPHFRFHAGLGLAGCEVLDATRAFLKRLHPFKTIQLASDAHVACLGAHLGRDGAIIIVGTGVVGYEIENGHVFKVGGWGFPHDDEGGGAWLGLEATRLTCQWLDHRAEKSPLVTDIFAFFNEDKEQFTAWANTANSSEFARLAPIVINHSQQEEMAAVRLIKKAAHAVDRIAFTLAKMTKSKQPLPCCLSGGIAPFIEPYIHEDVRAHMVPREGDACRGAILMIKQSMVEPLVTPL